MAENKKVDLLIAPLPDLNVQEELQWLFDAARDEVFEDGMMSAFSEALTNLIDQHGDLALDLLTEMIIHDKVNANAAAEALKWIGKIKNPTTHYKRRISLEQCLLNCRYASVRDGALLGLAAMDDPSTIPALEAAITKEPVKELQQNMRQTLTQFQNTLLEIEG